MKVRLSAINRFFNIIFGAMAMFAVALISAFLAMRLAIHGREVEVPNLAGLTVSDASKAASARELNLNLENRFYSPNVAPGHILAQSPAPGATVRREWTVRVTESLGSQQVSIPNLIGQTERPASIMMQRLSLDLGAVAQMAAPGDSGIVLAQTPAANASGIDRPRVSLLLSAPDDAASAYVMPSLTGLTLAGAAARAAAAGMHIASLEDISVPPPVLPGGPAPGSATPSANRSAAPLAAPSATGEAVAQGTVVDQSPPAGYRVIKGEAVTIKLTH